MNTDTRNGERRGSVQSGVLRLRTYEGDREVPYRIRRSVRARAIRISIDRRTGLILTLPPGAPASDGIAFLESKTAWLRRHLSRLHPPCDLRQYLSAERAVSIDGERVPLVLTEGAPRTVLRYTRGAGSVVVEIGAEPTGDLELAEVLRGLAARVLPGRTRALADRFGFQVKRVSVRDQAARWGSCSTGGSISLNWRLLIVPPEIQDYVICHELAHLREMNHSPRYWRELLRLDPAARDRDRWLNEAGEEIMALGRAG